MVLDAQIDDTWLVEDPVEPRRHPKFLVADACARYGHIAVVRWCIGLLTGSVDYDDPDSISLGWIGGGPGLQEACIGNLEERGQDYWPRVWAARAFLYVWEDEATPAVCSGLTDPAWRVREMCAKVVVQREIGAAADDIIALASDRVPRVRAAAIRALGSVGEADGAQAIRRCLEDDDIAVRRQAERSLVILSRRLDREV